MENVIEVEMKVNVRMNVSWTDALKLRLMGSTAAKRLLDELIAQIAAAVSESRSQASKVPVLRVLDQHEGYRS